MPLGSDLNIASEVLGGIEGGIQLFSSLADEKRKKKELGNLSQPFYQIQNEYIQNRNLAADQAQTGIPASTKDYLTRENQRGLGAGISGVIQGGGNINDIGKLFTAYSDSIDKTAAEDAEAKAKNIDYFIGVNKDLAGQKTTQWALNKYQPYQAKVKQLTEDISADKQNAFGGANTAIGAVTAAGTSFDNSDLMKILFSKNKSSNNTSDIPPSQTTDFAPFKPVSDSIGSSIDYINPLIPTPRYNG